MEKSRDPQEEPAAFQCECGSPESKCNFDHLDEESQHGDSEDQDEAWSISAEVAIAIRMRANYIETGTVDLSFESVQRLVAEDPENAVHLEPMIAHTRAITQADASLVAILRRHAEQVALEN